MSIHWPQTLTQLLLAAAAITVLAYLGAVRVYTWLNRRAARRSGGA